MSVSRSIEILLMVSGLLTLAVVLYLPGDQGTLAVLGGLAFGAGFGNLITRGEG